jgi:hypothetical protein
MDISYYIKGSVNIVSDYRLDDRATGVQSPADAKNFPLSSLSPDKLWAHPAFYPMGTGVLFPD